MKARSGFTLIELLVVIAIIATCAVVSGLALERALPRVTATSPETRMAQLRIEAIQRGRPQSTVLDSSGRRVTAMPDGRVLVDSQPIPR